MQEAIRTRSAFTLMGLARRVSNDRPEQIGQLWQAFLESGGASQILNRRGDDVYALYTDYEGDHTRPFTMLIGCEVGGSPSPSQGLVTRVVPAAKYAVFEARGPQPASLIAAWKHIWAASIERAYTADFDHYKGVDIVEIHVAVR